MFTILNQETYEIEKNLYSSSLSDLTKNEIEEIKSQIENEKKWYTPIELLYSIAVDWHITIIVIKYIMSL